MQLVEAITVLEGTLAQAKQWRLEREAWVLVCDRQAAAEDRAFLFELAGVEAAKAIIYDKDGVTLKPAWRGGVGGEAADASMAERKRVLSRFRGER